MTAVQREQIARRCEFIRGQIAPYSGKYRCTTCGHLQAFEYNQRFCVCDICGLNVRTWLLVKTESGKKQ